MMIAILMFCAGLMLNSFFSGTETGFYRQNRARLLLNALEGDWISRGLLWAVNNPAVFVATALVGNNVANFILASSIGMVARLGFPHWNAADVVLPALLAPLLFVYGDLLPKNVFLAAPNRLLRRCAIPFAIAAVLFAPISLVLWLTNKLLEVVGQKSPELLQMTIARRELGELLDEGQAVGLLQPTQQALAQATISLGPQSIAAFIEPASRFPRLTATQSPAEALTLARRSGQSLLPVEEMVGTAREVTCYVRAVDCALASDAKLPVRPIVAVGEKKPYLATLSLMLAADAPIARVTNRKKQTVGYVTLAGLQAALMAE